MKKLLMIGLMLFTYIANAQPIDTQQVFVATSEQEMYKLFNQMLDSARVSNRFIHTDARSDPFGFSFAFFSTRDTIYHNAIMQFSQNCWERSREEVICDRGYWGYISNSMPIDFYARFLEHLRQLDVIENFFIKRQINNPLLPVARIIKNQYESGKLNEQDSIKARQLIEETLLRLINDDHRFGALRSFHEFVTDTIRHALVNVLENPFFPAEYLEFFMNQQDTLHLDTIGIPPHIKANSRRPFEGEEEVYAERFRTFLHYERMGQRWGGLSAGEAYLERRRREFHQTGLFPHWEIRNIERYAYEQNDELLIKHLKKFRERFPDFPLEHF